MGLTTGNRIKKIREFRNYTQEHMAEKLGISQNVYSKIENDKLRLTADRLKTISQVLEVPVETILNDDLQSSTPTTATITVSTPGISSTYTKRTRN